MNCETSGLFFYAVTGPCFSLFNLCWEESFTSINLYDSSHRKMIKEPKRRRYTQSTRKKEGICEGTLFFI